MPDYLPEEIVDMALCLGASGGNFRQASRIYAQRYPERRHPDHKTIKRCVQRVKDGHVKRRRRRRQVPSLLEIGVLGVATLNPNTSLRQIERLHNVPRSSASRYFRYNKFHPYRITLHQELNDNDHRRRLRFCQWARQQMNQDPNFFSYVMFSDEANFNNRGQVNRYNYRYWSNQNPHWLRQIPHQHQWSFNVWCGLVNGYVVGPHFFDGPLTANRYNNFLQNELPVLLENVDLHTRQRLWFQQDGAPAHSARAVRGTLNNVFRNGWLGISGTVEFPPRSPDLIALDFFLWGYLKNIIYQVEPTTPEDMKRRIVETCRNISAPTLQRVENSFRNRVNLCIEANGQAFEYLLA